jgi:chemotaxis protein MotB
MAHSFKGEPTDRRLATISEMSGPKPKHREQPKKSKKRRKRGSSGRLLMVLAFVSAGAGGYHAWEYRSALAEANAQLELLRSSKPAPPVPVLVVDSESLAKASEELAECEQQVRELEQRPVAPQEPNKELQALTKRFRKMIDSGKLQISFRRGQMVVKLPARVLFTSGQAGLSERGRKALAEVATVLREMRGRRFIVSGHTDSVPINSEEFTNNWELSTARALSVTWMLIDEGVPPRSLAAAGHGQHKPIASNKTAKGRQLNRRIEIILEPDLRALPLKRLAKRTAKRGKRRR